MLFDPITISGTTVENRVSMTSMVTRLATEEGFLSPVLESYYLRRARGGVGLIVVEGTVAGDFRSKLALSINDDRFVPRLKHLVDRIHSETSTKLSIQLVHVLKRGVNYKQKVEDLTIQDIERVVNEMGSAAVRAEKAGFDFIEVHLAHSVLLASFVSLLNKRNDEYGRTLEGRMKIMTEVLQRIRDQTNIPVGCRISADEFIIGGNTLQQSRIFAKKLAEAGVAYISVSCGGKFEDSKILPDGTILIYSGYSAERTFPPSYMPDAVNVYLAGDIRKVVEPYKVPVVTAGKIPLPELAEAILQEGKADLIGLGRPLLCDPDWPKKAKEGKSNEIVKCKYDSACLQLDRLYKPIECIQWKSSEEGWGLV
jgi:2,4-dienoyl-CoA reductase-like NADH-dependent reductase (Old Yellow Enzyme family)